MTLSELLKVVESSYTVYYWSTDHGNETTELNPFDVMYNHVVGIESDCDSATLNIYVTR